MTGTELDPDGTDSFHPDHPWEQTTHPWYIPPIARTTGNWPPVDADPAGPHEAAVWAALPLGRRGHVEPTVQVPVTLIERIEDLAPGTMFTEEVRWTVTGTLSTGSTVAHSVSGEMRFADRFDPSTIRDVTPPTQ